MGTKPKKNVLSEDAQNKFGCKYIFSCKLLVVNSAGSFGEKMSKKVDLGRPSLQRRDENCRTAVDIIHIFVQLMSVGRKKNHRICNLPLIHSMLWINLESNVWSLQTEIDY